MPSKEMRRKKQVVKQKQKGTTQSSDPEEPAQTDESGTAKSPKQPKWADQQDKSKQRPDAEYPDQTGSEILQDHATKQVKKHDRAGTSSGCCAPCSTEPNQSYNSDYGERPEVSSSYTYSHSSSYDSCPPCDIRRVQPICPSSMLARSTSDQPTRKSKESKAGRPQQKQPKTSNKTDNADTPDQSENVAESDGKGFGTAESAGNNREPRSDDEETENSKNDEKPAKVEKSAKAERSAKSETSQGTDESEDDAVCAPCSNGPPRPASRSAPCDCNSGCGSRPATRQRFPPVRSCSSFPSYRPRSRCFF